MTEFLTQHSYLIAHIFGFAAMAIAIFSYQFTKHRTIMILMILCSGFWCLHYVFLGLFTPVMMNFVNVIRNIVYSFRDRKWANNNLIPVGFMILSAVLAAVTWNNIWSILPLAGAFFTTAANWQTDTEKLKYLTVPVCLCWFAFNLISRSYAGALNETFTLVSIIISLVRIHKKEKYHSISSTPEI